MNKFLNETEELELRSAINIITSQYRKVCDALLFLKGYNEGLFLSGNKIPLELLKNIIKHSSEGLNTVQDTIDNVLSIYNNISKSHIREILIV